MMKTKTPAELWRDRSAKEGECHLNASCHTCLKVIPIMGPNSRPSTSDQMCRCGETTTIREVLEAHGLAEFDFEMSCEYVRGTAGNES